MLILLSKIIILLLCNDNISIVKKEIDTRFMWILSSTDGANVTIDGDCWGCFQANTSPGKQGHCLGRMGSREGSPQVAREGGFSPEEWMALLRFCITCIRAPTSPSELWGGGCSVELSEDPGVCSKQGPTQRVQGLLRAPSHTTHTLQSLSRLQAHLSPPTFQPYNWTPKA